MGLRSPSDPSRQNYAKKCMKFFMDKNTFCQLFGSFVLAKMGSSNVWVSTSALALAMALSVVDADMVPPQQIHLSLTGIK
jgi:hypothetical protein